ncbi:MAG: polyheme membrane-associated cytochrome C, partial [Anaerolineae bacterium]|nr:polyheme membrane-associated cytochrome C [Anaerolineae bacterium]
CIDCHNPHTLELKLDECAACHTGVSNVEDLRDVRMPGSQVDYDSDGDISEGVYFELVGLQEKLYAA